MPQAIFGSGQAATLEKTTAAGGLKMINLTSVVVLDNFAILNFGQQVSKIKSRIQRTDRYSAIGRQPGQITR